MQENEASRWNTWAAHKTKLQVVTEVATWMSSCKMRQKTAIFIVDHQTFQVVPELDAPAHVGAGWQAVDEKLTVCVNREPWTEWWVEYDTFPQIL